jgi:hypothetical protein
VLQLIENSYDQPLCFGRLKYEHSCDIQAAAIRFRHSCSMLQPQLCQNCNFNASCNCRADPKSPFANRVLVITPKLEDPTLTFGLPKLG